MKVRLKDAVDQGLYFCPSCKVYHDNRGSVYTIPERMIVAIKLAEKFQERTCLSCKGGLGLWARNLRGVKPDEG